MWDLLLCVCCCCRGFGVRIDDLELDVLFGLKWCVLIWGFCVVSFGCFVNMVCHTHAHTHTQRKNTKIKPPSPISKSHSKPHTSHKRPHTVTPTV